MTNPKITYESWEVMGADAMTIFLEQTPQGRIHELLVGVHPELRVADLDSNDWRHSRVICHRNIKSSIYSIYSIVLRNVDCARPRALVMTLCTGCIRLGCHIAFVIMLSI